jgi:hypothetical protein
VLVMAFLCEYCTAGMYMIVLIRVMHV